MVFLAVGEDISIEVKVEVTFVAALIIDGDDHEVKGGDGTGEVKEGGDLVEINGEAILDGVKVKVKSLILGQIATNPFTMACIV